MATGALISVDEYLRTSYRPDCDYVDGSIEERNLGLFEHSTLQMLVLLALDNRALEWGVIVRPELRLRLREGKYRVPDAMVLAAGVKHPAVIDSAPLLCIEIVSPDDTLNDLTKRAADYLALGVPETWTLDSATRKAYVHSSQGLHESTTLHSGPIRLDLPTLFAGL